MHELNKRFDDAQLQHIMDQALIYMCACPAQVAREILRLRELYAYQTNCLQRGGVLDAVHQRIAQATVQAHALMEDCLDEILTLEAWDRQRLDMPPHLRQLRDQSLQLE